MKTPIRVLVAHKVTRTRNGGMTRRLRCGGIPEWLTDGVNGCLAPANPPTPRRVAAGAGVHTGEAPRKVASRS